MRCSDCVKCTALVGCLVLAAGLLVLLIWQFPFDGETVARPDAE